MSSLDDLLIQDKGTLEVLDAKRSTDAIKVLENNLLPQVRALQLGIKGVLEKELDSESADNLSKLHAQSLEINRALEVERVALLGSRNGNSQTFGNHAEVSYWSAVIPRIISVRLTALFYTLGVFSGQFQRNGIEGVLAGMLGIVPLMIVLLPLSQIIKKVKRGRFMLFLFTFLSEIGRAHV